MRRIVKLFNARKAHGLHTTEIFKEAIQIIFRKFAPRRTLSDVISKLTQKGKQDKSFILAQNTSYRQFIGTASTLPSWEWLSLPRDVNYAFELYKHHIGQLMDRCNFYVKDKVIVELGPGSNLGLSLCLIASGAQKVYCIDKYYGLSQNLGPFYKKLMRELVRRSSELAVEENIDNETVQKRLTEAVTFKADEAIFNADKISYICPCDATELPFDDATIDLVSSHAVLEHVGNLRRVISENARVLKQGGHVSHQVDLRDHRNFDIPLDFLRYSPILWDFINYKGAYGNRVRFFEYLQVFREADFELLDCQAQVINDFPTSSKKGFYKEFRNLQNDELSVLRFYLIAKKGE